MKHLAIEVLNNEELSQVLGGKVTYITRTRKSDGTVIVKKTTFEDNGDVTIEEDIIEP